MTTFKRYSLWQHYQEKKLLLLIEAEADAVEGKTMTSYPSVKKDLMNAGANRVDKEVAADKGLVTSRSPKDLQAINKKIAEKF